MDDSATATVLTGAPPSDPPFFTLDLSPRYAPRSFATFEDLKNWILSEQSYFGFLSSNPQLRNSGAPFADIAPQTDFFVGAQQRLQVIEANLANTDAVASQLAKLQRHYKANYVDSARLLLSDDPRAKYIEKLWSEGLPSPIVAAWTLVSFIGRPANMNDPMVFEGFTRATLFNLGITDKAESESLALVKLRDDYQSRLDSLDARRRDLATATETATAAATRSAVEHATAFTEAQTTRETDYKQLRNESATAFEQLRKAFTDHMSLEAPVTFWRRKAKMHAIWACVFTGLFFAFLYSYVSLAAKFLPSLIGLLSEVTRAAGDALVDAGAAQAVPASDATQSIPIYVALFAIALVGIWLMRILVRITLSHIHLGTDAKHRSVCVESYLALLGHSDKAVGENERAIILTQLFRPASDGLVRDDAMPPTLFERITSTGR